MDDKSGESPDVVLLSQLEGESREAFDLATEAAQHLSEALGKFVEELTSKQKKTFSARPSFFIYNTLSLHAFQELYHLNTLSLIPLEDAITNIDVMTTSLKKMLTGSWEAILRERDTDETTH